MKPDVQRATDTAVLEQTCTEQLARFFPRTVPLRLPVQVTARRGGRELREATVLEFGGKENAIFVSSLPLEFDDDVKLEWDSPKRSADASVIAVQYYRDRKAVAVKFNKSCDWMTQP
jgi:hypothetical protein